MTTTFDVEGAWLPTQLKAMRYGSGTVEKYLFSSLPHENSKAFIITGNSLATKTDLIKKVEALLKGEHLISIPKFLIDCF